jgi:hypothetical protein
MCSLLCNTEKEKKTLCSRRATDAVMIETSLNLCICVNRCYMKRFLDEMHIRKGQFQ